MRRSSTYVVVKNWRRRVIRGDRDGPRHPDDVRPYDLRHSFVSLLIREGRSVVEVAQQAGHAPTMTLATYARVRRART